MTHPSATDTASAGDAAPGTLLSMADIARLARVRRPVVTIWRRRKATGTDPFPEPVNPGADRLHFNASQIAAWLTRTGLGNNPTVSEDAPAYARTDERWHEATAFEARLAALLTLKALTDADLTDLEAEALIDLADDVDPHDEFLFSELSAAAASPGLPAHAESVANAAYSAAAALERSVQDGSRHSEHGAHALSPTALTLVADLANALLPGDSDEAHFADPRPGSGDLLMAVRSRLPEQISSTAHTSSTGSPGERATVRRLVASGWIRHPLAQEPGQLPHAVVLAHFPAADETPLTTLQAIDNLALELAPDQRAVIVAPAQVLIDPLTERAADNLRAGLLRLDKVRSIVRLPAGCVPRRPRQMMALWVLGAAHPDVPGERRWTTISDLSDVSLTAAVSTDVVNDTLAAMGNEATVRAHAFHYSRRIAARRVIATSGPLIQGPTTAPPRRLRDGAEVAQRITALGERLDGDTHPPLLPHLDLVPTNQTRFTRAPGAQTVQHWLGAGALQLLPGHRIDAEHLGATSGAPILDADRLDRGQWGPGTPQHIGLLALATHYPAARLSEPGDVVFTIAGGLRAVVDTDGGGVTRFPVRTLRVVTDSALDPEMVCWALNQHGRAGGNAWRSVAVPPISPDERVPLREAMTAIDHAQAQAMERLEALRDLKHEVLDGLSARSLTFDSTQADEGP
ncbi:hypothetical protein [Pseudactinotalea sp. Z1748]|uniref:hypothetical protein n=1 Tax=Pseudactinotalea sp. Z1748 TaxID=3413027 RepID=UPI003C799295